MTLGRIHAVQITTVAGEAFALLPDTRIWTSGIADLDPQAVGLTDVPKTVYGREPCWLFFRDTTVADDDWQGDTERHPVVHALYVPAIAGLSVIYDEAEGD